MICTIGLLLLYIVSTGKERMDGVGYKATVIINLKLRKFPSAVNNVTLKPPSPYFHHNLTLSYKREQTQQQQQQQRRQ